MKTHTLSTFLAGLAPSSGLTCSIEGDPAPEGGATPGSATPPPAPAAPAPGSFTPEQLAYIESEKAKARDAGAAATRRALEGRPRPNGDTPQRTDTPQPAPQPTGTVDIRAEMARVRAFERAANRYGLSDAALAVLEEDFNRANPTDPASWVTQRADAFGWKAGAHTQPNPAGNGSPSSAPAPAPAATTPPPSMPGSAPPSRVVTADTRIVDMSIADRDALTARIGEKAFRDRLRAEMKGDTRRIPLPR